MRIDLRLLAAITRAVCKLDVIPFITTAIAERYLMIHIHLTKRQRFITD